MCEWAQGLSNAELIKHYRESKAGSKDEQKLQAEVNRRFQAAEAQRLRDGKSDAAGHAKL